MGQLHHAESLIAALRDQEADVRQAAIAALGIASNALAVVQTLDPA